MRRTALPILLLIYLGCRMMPASELPMPGYDAAPESDAADDVEPFDASADVIEEDAAPEEVADAAVEADTDGSAPAGPEGMLLVPGGTYAMGRDEGGEGDERPAHDVTVASFWLDRTEVTQAAYEECIKAGVCKAPDEQSINAFNGLFKGPNKPIVGVSWHDATKYCAWKGKRLPKEAEFERAVRDSDGRRYPWGNDPPTHERTVFDTNSPEEVGTHPLGKGPYGHEDLAGNVWEWIDDDYDPFAYQRGRVGTCDEIKATQDKLRAEHKQGFTGSNPIPTVCEKTIRGGAYNYPAHGLRSTNRVHHPAGFRLRMTGLRCARDF